MSKSKKSRALRKPKKPYGEFPLTPHPCGKWASRNLLRTNLSHLGTNHALDLEPNVPVVPVA
jgi:hypothetical protein